MSTDQTRRSDTVGPAIEPQLYRGREFYRRLAYSSYSTLFSLVEQSRWALLNGLSEILYVGVGNGFVPTYLRAQGVQVTTADIDASLRPDIVCDVRTLVQDLRGRKFQAIMACEVCEHLPLEDFEVSVRQLRESSTDRVFMTLPEYSRFPVKIAGVATLFRREFAFGAHLRVRKKTLPEGHLWELNSESRSNVKAIRTILQAAFVRCRDYRLKVNPYHRAFDLRCRDV